MRFSAVFICLFACPLNGNAQKWPVVPEDDPDTMPSLEINLDSPPLPLPQVTAEIEALEKRRERLEASGFKQMVSVYKATIKSAKKRVGGIIARAMRAFDDEAVLESFATTLARKSRRSELHGASFLSSHHRQEPALEPRVSVKVNVVPGPAPDSKIKPAIDKVEQLRYDAEQINLEKAEQDMRGLADAVLSQVETELRLQLDASVGRLSQVSLLETNASQMPMQANVRIAPSANLYPTVVGLVQNMESRRTAAEKLLGAKILQLNMQLLRELNVIVADALEAAMERVVTQYTKARS